MSEKRISIYSGPEMARVLGDRESDANTLTQTINSIIDRYGEICARNRPALTEREWLAVCDCCNGTWFAPAATISGSVLANVEDSPELAEKWEIDQAALCRKLSALNYCAEISLIDTIERFWACSDHVDSAARLKKIIGAHG